MTGSDYWEKRMDALEGMVDRNSRITAAEIGKVYDDALTKLERDIKKIFHSYAKGYGISAGEAEKLLSQTQTREIRERLTKLIAETPDPVAQMKLRAVLDAPAYAFRISKLEALRAECYADMAEIGISETAYHKARLADTYRESYYRTAFDLSQEQGVNVPFHRLSARETSAAIERLWSPGVGTVAGNYSTRVWGNTTALAENVREIITRGILTQASYSDMIAELTVAMGTVESKKKIAPDGTSITTLSGNGAKYRAARLVRTECNYVSGQARMSAYSDAGIERYFFRARLELRTCRKCGDLDGKVFAVSDQKVGENMHPMHPQCRCYEGPYREKNYLDMVKRAAQTGAEKEDFELVPQSMTYQQWREKYVDTSPEMLEAEKALKGRKKPEAETVDVSAAKWNRKQSPFKVVPKRWTELEGS